ncbi:TMEM165/GDT1 family protein [Rhodospirillaceae bacterium KN72]|uniref:TMEM165/GDT1 family protein n=1 Tax=Pacificispira spongiicola TaxID=2729598 RepID=A0A7Y0E275_9PROT|nr:TMEM165/GDT1 family protein [Pacificispira spongiicola]NMM45889.1 TMEM165/GDT1 family protein [Pacificispira spongiicola]
MPADFWTVLFPAVAAAFLASIVEVVEAFTIVLAVGTTRGWKPAVAGTASALAVLGLVVLILGPALRFVPIQALQLVVGVLLLLFGMGWLRKAVLRSADVLPLHDELEAFAAETADLAGQSGPARTLAWIAGIAAFKAVLLEGLEVAFIVVAVGAGKGLLWEASFGALAACLLVLCVGMAVHKPLARVPENTLKFGVGVMLSAFGVFWTGEGLGIEWPGADLCLPVLAVVFLAVGILLARLARITPEGNAA